MEYSTPFYHVGPVLDPDYFFDRQDVLAKIKALVSKRQSVALIGPRRIGKTSLLRQLINPVVGKTESSICWVYLDCQGWRSVTPEGMYARIAEAVSAMLSIGDGEINNAMRVPSRCNKMSLCATEQFLRRANIPIVVILDEFDELCAAPGPNKDLLAGLRKLAMQGFVSFITGSTQSLQSLTCRVLNSNSPSFFNFFCPLWLGLLDTAMSREMLHTLSARGGIPFSSEIVDRLIYLAGPHPLYLQLAGRGAFEHLVKHSHLSTSAAWEQVRQSFLDEVAPHWRYAWNALDEEDRRLLALLPLYQNNAPMGMRRLEQAGLIIRDANGQATWLSREFQAFVGHQPVGGLKQLSPITLDLRNRAVLSKGVLLALSPNEFDLLYCLADANGEVLSQKELEKRVYHQRDHADINGGERLKTTLKSLRRILGDAAACIENIRGVGYRFNQLCD